MQAFLDKGISINQFLTYLTRINFLPFNSFNFNYDGLTRNDFRIIALGYKEFDNNQEKISKKERMN